MRIFCSLILGFLLLLLAQAGQGLSQGLPITTPDAVNVSAEALKEITEYNSKLISAGKIPGAVTVVARHGKVVYFETLGMRDKDASLPMRPDTIFRIASMTKPIASIATMVLYDEGKLRLDDPLSKFIVEFKDVKYLNPISQQFEPTPREITVKDLLTHTAGFTYSSYDNPVAIMYRKARLAEGLCQEAGSLEENMRKLAEIPLLFPPGEQWEYGMSSDVLGRVVEHASGMTFDEFLRKKVFGPLQMNDTHFFLPPEKVDRLAVVYRLSKEGKLEPLADGKTYRLAVSPKFGFEYSETVGFPFSVDYPYRGPRNYFSGNAGLCSTVPDYLRFCQMLLNGGELDGVQILKPETVKLITSNQIGELETSSNPHEGNKFGLGFSIFEKNREDLPPNLLGSLGWGGFFRTNFLIAPKGDWIVISMSQVVPDEQMSPWMIEIRKLAANAIR
jgi:CubicO group peptidase (beta-lactamase class C family)